MTKPINPELQNIRDYTNPTHFANIIRLLEKLGKKDTRKTKKVVLTAIKNIDIFHKDVEGRATRLSEFQKKCEVLDQRFEEIKVSQESNRKRIEALENKNKENFNIKCTKLWISAFCISVLVFFCLHQEVFSQDPESHPPDDIITP